MSHRPLSKAQRRHLEQLLAEVKAAEVAAQRFLGYCAEEHRVELGEDGWQFDIEAMAFVQAPLGYEEEIEAALCQAQ